MFLIKLLPKSNSDLSGIIEVNHSNIQYNTECNSDFDLCDKLFLHTLTQNSYWGALNKNDWVKITFKKELLYLTHYSLQASCYNNRPKGVLIEGIRENGEIEIIDNNTETGLTSSLDILTKEVNKTGPYKSIKFSVFDRYGIENNWFSGLFGIDVFGILAPKSRKTCAQKYKPGRTFFNTTRQLFL